MVTPHGAASLLFVFGVCSYRHSVFDGEVEVTTLEANWPRLLFDQGVNRKPATPDLTVFVAVYKSALSGMEGDLVLAFDIRPRDKGAHIN
jgi:hypothetical protein